MRPFSTTPTFPTPEDPAAAAASLPGSPSPFLYAEQLGIPPLPESPVPCDGKPYLSAPRHHQLQVASVSSGPHAVSPLAQAPLVPAETGLLHRNGQGKLRAD